MPEPNLPFAIGPLVIGAILGVAVVSIALRAVPRDPDPAAVSSSSSSPFQAGFDRAGLSADGAALESMLDRTIGQPSSLERTAELHSLLLNLASIDPKKALRYALSAGVGARTLSALFVGWVETDPRSALAGLSLIERPADLRVVSLALLDVLGANRDGIAVIASALPAADRMNFTFDAIASRAETNPEEAIALALSLDDSPAQAEALSRIAKTLAGADPSAAWSHVASIESYALADAFKASLLEEWASTDVEGFLAFVESAASARIPRRSNAFEIAAAIDPRRLLSMLDEIPQGVRPTAGRAALEALVRLDAGAAFSHIDTLPAGESRESLRMSVARSFARHDLEDALAWLDAGQLSGEYAAVGILQVLAEADPVRGAEALLAQLESSAGMDARSISLVIPSFTPAPRDKLSVVANRLSDANDPVVQIAYGMFLDYWSRNDAEAAHDWALANSSRLTPSSLANLARNVAAQRPDLAKQAADRIAPDVRAAWIRSVAEELARNNVDDTLSWIARYEGQPVYEQAVEAALQGLWFPPGIREADPESVARFIERQSPQLLASSIPEVANFWAEQDPRGAARWVEQAVLDAADESRRYAAMSNVATQWASREANAARDWVLGLPRGEGRDQVLASLLGATAAAGSVDSRAIDAFSSDGARQRALAYLMGSLGRSDPELGRQLIDRYIDDPEYRAIAEKQLIEGPSSPFAGGVAIYN